MIPTQTLTTGVRLCLYFAMVLSRYVGNVHPRVNYKLYSSAGAVVRITTTSVDLSSPLWGAVPMKVTSDYGLFFSRG